ncbi:MAG: class I SAM-dependent methyltransferase, partial [Verrucomicrobiota bacterium]
LSLKDATAFNIQFEDTWPIFIDLTSIEKPARLDIWIAYGQFCRMFLYPLILRAHRGVPLPNNFLGSLDGVEVEQVYAILGPLRSFAPDMSLDVGLPFQLNKKKTSSNETLLKNRVDVQKGGSENSTSQLMNLSRLEKKILKYKSRVKRSGLWSDYQKIRNYSDEESRKKRDEIQTFLDAEKPARVLDLGCNTGEFSELAAKSGARVISVDSDHDCIDHLYLHARENRLSILPLVVNLSNPSPGLGFRNRERSDFMSRINGECVFALALIHHLLITGRIPLPEIRDLFRDLTERWLIVEYIGREDDMFQTLLALREDIYQDFTKDAFESTFGEAFSIEKQTQLSAHRHLYVMRKI